MPSALRLLAGSLVVAACGSAPGADDAGRCGSTEADVERVLDGDTVELQDGRHVRYLLVDTPEIAHNASEVDECFGPEAKALNTSLVLGAALRLEFDEECEDRFGRTLAYVWLTQSNVMVNQTLLDRGYARLLVIPPNDKYRARLENSEAAAQAAQAGLWGACE